MDLYNLKTDKKYTDRFNNNFCAPIYSVATHCVTEFGNSLVENFSYRGEIY